MNSILPWQIDHWKLLHDQKRQNRLPHAILLTGLSGLGKARFAKQLGQSLICESVNEDGTACGLCRQCEWVLEGVHPDWFELSPSEDNKTIKIDDIRALIRFQQKTFSSASSKLILIHQAHHLNKNAANALLKTLEEPGNRTHILLDTNDAGRLPMTIRSRCQIISFKAPSRKDALAWILKESVQADQAELYPQRRDFPRCAEERAAGLNRQDCRFEWRAPGASPEGECAGSTRVTYTGYVRTASDDGSNMENSFAKGIDFCLSLSNNAPLCALKFLKQNEWEFHQTLMKEFQDFYAGRLSLVDLSARWAKLDIHQVLRHFETWVYDLIYLYPQRADFPRGAKERAAGAYAGYVRTASDAGNNVENSIVKGIAQNTFESILNKDMLSVFEKITCRSTMEALYRFLDFFHETKRVLKQGIVLNTQLVLEDLLIQYRRLG